jgi:hypothetical protein
MKMSLGLESANKSQGFDVIPAGTQCVLVMKIRPGTVGLEGLLKRTKAGNAAMLDVEFTVLGGDYDKYKVFASLVLDGTTEGHGKAGEFSRALLRAIFEATHGIAPGDTSSAAQAHRASATLAGFNGATFLAVVEIEKGKKKPEDEGGGFYKDKNVIGKVLRVGDKGYRKLDQPAPSPIPRDVPPQPSTSGATAAPEADGSPAPAIAAIKKPSWAE